MPRTATWMSSGDDGVPDPGCFIAVDRDHVEPTGGRHAIALQIMMGGSRQSLLLGRCNAGSGTAVTAIGTLADLDENQYVAFLHDQIELAALAQKITLDQHQPALLKIGQRSIFAELTGNLFLGTWPPKIGNAHRMSGNAQGACNGCTMPSR